MDASVKASSTASALVVAAADKAGMEGIDRTQIDAIILRESGDSSFMKQQKHDSVLVYGVCIFLANTVMMYIHLTHTCMGT